MDDVVTIEYRGISGHLAVGSTVTVEFCGAGVPRLRRAPVITAKVEKSTSSPKSAGSDSKGDTHGS